MQVKSIRMNNKNRLNVKYRAQHSHITPFFHYHPFQDFERRMEDVRKRDYKRNELSEILTDMNRSWGATDSTFEQIDRLKASNSVVVIGGQQAGLLTGPTYSINKVISIIRLAKEQEEKLNVPVIPVFWIAGEDHDYDEVNHVFALENNQLYKHTLQQVPSAKKSLSDIEIDHEKAETWLKSFLHHVKETSYTKQWFQETLTSLKASSTYTDFFARLIFQIFPNEGLVLMDAHAPKIRKLESDYFIEMIQKQEQIHLAAYETLQQLQQKGYEIPIDMEKGDTNLFYRGDDGERILLICDGDKWIGKNEEVMFTKEAMLDIAKNNPERLSNNVVTRPLMQELLFPTLAFVAGDGEINYWATLKSAFEVMEINMPPVVPRLSFTYLTRRVQKLLETRVLDVEEIIHEGVGRMRINWLTAQSTVPVETLFEQVKQNIAHIHAPLQAYTATISPDLEQLAEKNAQYMEKQMDFLKQKTYQKLEAKFALEMSQFDEISQAVKPRENLQERIWHPFYMINEYGYTHLRDMLELPELSFQKEHFIVYV